MLPYKVIEIFTGEEVRWEGRSPAEAVVECVKEMKIAGRCLVTRAIEGCYENGEVATGRLEILSYNMPLHITVVIPAFELERVLPKMEAMVTDGIVAVRDLDVVSHRTRRFLVARHTRVKDIMTPSPRRVETSTPLSEVVRLLLSSVFSGVPVVDGDGRPVGIITQGDLIYRAGMPMRIGLLAESNDQVSAVLESLARKKAEEAMTGPAITIGEDRMVTEAVDLMIEKGVKRLPVTDTRGTLVGMFSRLDVFRTIMKEAPDWSGFKKQNIEVGEPGPVSDIMRRDTHAVPPDTPVEEVMRIIDSNDIQRVAVVDEDGYFQGLISDRDLLAAFLPKHREGIWEYFVSRIPFAERGRGHGELIRDLRSKTAAEVMNRNIVIVREDEPLDTAILLMTEKALKRLPVVDSAGKFKGMISRDSILRAGFGRGK